MKKAPILTVLAIVTLAALGYFVWPTPYRYDHTKIGDNDLLVRMNRLSGKTEVLLARGWIVKEDETTSEDLPADRVAKLTGQASMTSYGWIEFEAYNGSDFKVSEITLLVTVFDAQKNQILSRPYRLTPEYYDLTPQSNEKFHASSGFNLARGQTWQFSVLSAKGKRE